MACELQDFLEGVNSWAWEKVMKCGRLLSGFLSWFSFVFFFLNSFVLYQPIKNIITKYLSNHSH